jgi:dsDNA-binding SOS-regulon protein
LPTSRDELDKDLLDLVEKGLLQMSYDEEKEDWVFWLTTEGDTLGVALEAQKENDESPRNH